MGNEQSGSVNGGISNSLSFLSGRKTVNVVRKKAGQVVVVRSGSDGLLSPSKDSTLKRFKDIPKFYPILKSALHQPGLHDSPDIKKKMSPRPILRLATCLQDYFARSAQLVANEQEYIGTKIKDIDYYVITSLNKINVRKKSLEILAMQTEKISEVKMELRNVKSKLEGLLPQIRILNDLLPEPDRLPPLSLIHLFETSPSMNTLSSGETDTSSTSEDASANLLNNLHIEPVEEYTVVDRVVRR